MGNSRLGPVGDDFVDPFDRLVLKGQSVRPVQVTRPAVSVVDLADEFELTTAAALDICDSLSIAAVDAGVSISASDADRFRVEARRRRDVPAVSPDEVPPVLSLRARLERHH